MVPTEIFIHHSLTKDSGTVSWGAIRKYHVEHCGWIDIGYHAGVELVYTEYEVFMGRVWDRAGAHTKGHNDRSLGFLFVGNYDFEPPPPKMLETGAKVVSYWMRVFNIPKEKIYPHNHFANYKTCPGLEFDMEEFKKWL